MKAGVIDACTIIAGNYLAAARVLAESFLAHHPDGSFTVLVVDDERREITPVDDLDRRIEWWRLADLGLDTAEIHRLAGIYDVTELSTSVKPLFLQRLMHTRERAVIYLDPDIRVFGSLAYVSRLADEHGLVLTPHITQPIPEDGRQIDALFILAAGVYNLGFAAAGPSAVPCLDWWWRQTRRRALNDIQRHMFTDQRWADFMPSLFSHHLLKDPGYNVAYWNLHERPVTRAHGRFYARNVPVRFFHFSGFDPRTPWLLSRHQGERPRILLSEHPVLAALCDDYAAALDRAGGAASSQRVYGWNVSAGGLAMTQRIRRVYWSAAMAAESGEGPEPPDPFDTAHPDAFTAWLNTADRGSSRWSRYLRAIYDARPDVRAHMPEIEGISAEQFGNWLRTDGVVQEHIPPALTPPAPSLDARANLLDPPVPHGLNVAGYFSSELGVGEAARQLIRAIDATGSPYSTVTQLAPLSRQEHAFEARDAVVGAEQDINLLCMNADVTAAFARNAGPALFAGRHTIGYWFWEVDPLPAGMHGAFDHVDEVWAATEYVAGIIRTAAAGRTPVFTVPLPLTAPPMSRAFTREELGFPADRFVFLFVFDFLSVMERKNPLGTIDAFCAAFAPLEGPLLVLKSINGHARMSELERLRRAAAHRSDIVIRDGYVSAGEKNAMLAACDCYVSLHRAEGLGLTLAEAMALGKPAIATGYSGNRHFMTDENSFLVGYRLTSASGECGPYAGAHWAEPDLAQAAQLMRMVYQHPGEAARRAERGQADLTFHHGVMSSATAISNRLEEIRRARAEAVAAVRSAAAAAALAAEEAAAAEAAAAEARAAELATPPAVPEPDPAIAMRVAALEAFTAAVPHLQQLGVPRVTVKEDERAWPWLRRTAQHALFRVMKPYWFQQRHFQDQMLEAVRVSFERLAGPGPAPPAVTAPPADPVTPTADEARDDTPAPESGIVGSLRKARRDLRTSLLIWFGCMLVFNANGRVINASDAIPARYQPFAILAHGTVFLDPIESLVSQGHATPGSGQIPKSGEAFWTVRRPTGHLISLYPVVLPVLISPLYVPAAAYVYARGWTDEHIELVARVMEKLTASFLAALSAAILYLVLRRRATTAIAMLLTIAYAFGTTTWVISSQTLWQHGMGELLVVGLMLVITSACTVPHALMAGLLCGLIAGNRPADAPLAAALGAYALFWAGRRAPLVILVASLTVLPVVIYNLAVTGALAGAYELVGKYTFVQHPMGAGLAGLLFSPTRGLFVFSPFLLFLALIWRYFPRGSAERGLTLAMITGVVLQTMLYGLTDWRAGVCYGPRFLTDLLPMLIWLLVPVVAALRHPGRAVFVAAVGVAIVIEGVGAVAYTGVTDVPIYAIWQGPDTLRPAWEWKNAPFIASLSEGRAPAELIRPMRGAIERLEVDGHPADTVVAGQDLVAIGWALAGRATPLQVAISIDGRDITAVQTFTDRPDVRATLPGAGPSGWRIPLKTTSLTPGSHWLSLYVWWSSKGDTHFLMRRTFTVQKAPAVAAPPGQWDLEASTRTAAARIREHQQAPGYWLTAFTSAPQFEQPHPEMNTYLTSMLVDLLSPLTAIDLGDALPRARRHLTAQIEATGLVRYHGLPDGPGMGTLGCPITPDTDDTALVWRIAPPPDRQRLASAIGTIDEYRRPDGLYRTWLAPRAAYQCLDPGRDPNPADVAIQMHLLQLLLTERPPAARALCESLSRHLDDETIWVYYQRSPLVPILRTRDLAQAGCRLALPAARMQTNIPGQQVWLSAVRLLARAQRPGASRADAAEIATVLRQLASDDFALLRQSPPLLYHNDLTATVARYYWSEDVGYALWLRLARDPGASPIRAERP